MNRNEWWDHSFQNSNSVPFNYSSAMLQAPKPQLLKPQTSLSRCCLYMPCTRNFWGAVWKTCRHGSPQHQFMPPPYGAHKIRQVTKFVGEISDAREWLIVQVQGWGVDAERMHNTSTKFTWWVDQSSTWRHFGPCTLQSSASGDEGNARILTMLASKIANPYCSNFWRTSLAHCVNFASWFPTKDRIKYADPSGKCKWCQWGMTASDIMLV